MSLFVFDAWRLDTTPGAPSQALSPPKGGMEMVSSTWIGLYLNLSATTVSAKTRKYCTLTARLNRPVKIEGPYRDTMIFALNSFNQKKKRTAI